MTKNKMVIPGRLPGLNEIITLAKQGRGGYQPYAIVKKQHTSEIALLASQLDAFDVVDIKISWYEPNVMRDIDNIAGGGQKFILDGLVQAGVIADDRQKHVKSITNYFGLDRKNPRIEVELKEVEDEPEGKKG